MCTRGRETRATSEHRERSGRSGWLAGLGSGEAACARRRRGWGAAALGIGHAGCPLPPQTGQEPAEGHRAERSFRAGQE